MPDGDRIYGKLTQAYEKPYEQICEGYFNDDIIAWNVLDAVKGDLKRYGEEPIVLIRQVVQRIQVLPREPLLKLTVDWNRERQGIERFARMSKGNRRGLDLAVEACKRYLHELQFCSGAADHTFALVEAYMQRVYEANFEERMPLGEHHNGVDQSMVYTRLEVLRPLVLNGLSGFASQVARRGKVSRLSRPVWLRKPETITADTDIFALS